MLALHGAQTVGGAQFYIGCAQLKVTGTGSATCGPTISIPGAYNAEDDNIYIPNVYNGFDASTYKAPGGPVASCGAGSGSTAPSTPKPANSTVPAVPSVVASPTVIASPSASAVVEATPTPVASAPAASSPVASSAPAPAPSSGAGNDGALPATFTLETFIAWLQGKVGSASKARRHARAF
jgi:cellulase